MYIIQDPWDSTQKKVCPFCTFDASGHNLTICEICETSLISQKVKIKKLNRQQKHKIDNTEVKSSSESSALGCKSLSPNAENVKNGKQINKDNNSFTSKLKSIKISKITKFLTTIDKAQFVRYRREIFAFVFIVIGLSFSVNQIKTLKQKSTIVNNSSNLRTTQTSSALSAPKGLFSYGGAPFDASLVSSGLNSEIEQSNPGFEWRYTKPTNNDFSTDNGIKMLIDGQLSLAFNNRPLKDREIQRAAMRGSNLKQVPVAIDGLVFFANSNLSVSPKLNIDQIKDIYEGKVTNWNQIDPQTQNVPIVPILLKSEDLTTLGIDSARIAPNAEYVANYTQLLRKLIAVPGGFSFASASLVKNQQLIKTFSVAETSVSKYVPAFINNSPNLTAFKQGYPLTRQIFVVYREDKTVEQKAGEAYVDFLNSSEGQESLEKSGLVPLR